VDGRFLVYWVQGIYSSHNTFERSARSGRIELEMHILVAAKQADLRLAIELYLTEEPGLEIVGTVSDAASLRALLQPSHPDLVLLDWDLPGPSPADLVTEAKGLASCPQVIVLGPDADAAPAALAAGADAFVVKGDPPRHLVTAVRQARSRQSPETEKPMDRKGE
jgi:DNA-binding NarL/FixJ family response regulator